MEKVSIIGLDLAKRSFQAHGAHADGGVAFRKKLSREKLLAFFAEQSRCVVAMEACGSAHHWGRTIRDLGHDALFSPKAARATGQPAGPSTGVRAETSSPSPARHPPSAAPTNPASSPNAATARRGTVR